MTQPTRSKFLILQLPLQLLRLGNLPDGLVEIILIDEIPIVFDSKQAPTIPKRKLALVSTDRNATFLIRKQRGKEEGWGLGKLTLL